MPSMLMVVLMGSSMMAQQRNLMTVTAPATIAGEYDVLSSAFGDQGDTEISGTLLLVDDADATTGSVTDACQPIVNDLTGTIALIDRGTCAFVDKCRNAQTAGATAVLVCNDAPITDTDRGGLLAMADSDPPATDITIACLFATLETCDLIRVELATGIDVTFSFFTSPCDPIDYPANAIFGTQPGEGDFDGGLNDWSIDSEFGLEWDALGVLDKGAYNTTRPFMETPSVCNGAVVCDSDFLDNGGVAGAFGTGDCPSDAGASLFCDSRLMSPVIDLSAFDTDGLVLVFSQAIRQFQSEYYVEISTDAGNTWGDTIQINQEFPTNSDHFLNNEQRIPLCGYDGESQFRFRFWIRGAYYYWGIDDVMILDSGFADGETIDNFFAVAPNFKTPVSQVEALPFLTSILNNGNSGLTNIELGIDIFNNTTATNEYSATRPYGDLAGCGREDNLLFTETYTPAPAAVTGTDVVEYTGSYTLTADNDTDGVNDTRNYNFYYTENTFAKVRTEAEVGSEYLAAIAPTSGAEYFSLGSHYHVVNGAAYEAVSVRAGLGNTAEDMLSGFYIAHLYKWVDIDGNGEVGSDERALIAEGQQLIFSGTTEFRDMEIVLESTLNESNVQLEDNTDYVLMMHTNPTVTGGEQWRILAGDVSDSPEYNYFEMGLAAADAGAPRYGSFFGTGAASDDIETRTFTQIGNFSTYAPLTIGLVSSSEDINKNLGVSVFPNPANDNVFFTMSLENVSDVQIELVNLEGKRAMTQTFNNVKEGQLRMDVSALTTGIYMANIRTEEGFTSKRIIIQK